MRDEKNQELTTREVQGDPQPPPCNYRMSGEWIPHKI